MNSSMYTTTLDVNKNYDSELLEHGFIHIQNKDHILFTPETFLNFAKTAITGVATSISNNKNDKEPVIIRITSSGFIGSVPLHWHADLGAIEECNMAIGYNKNNCHIMPTEFIKNKQILTEIFNNDLKYLEQIVIECKEHFITPSEQMKQRECTDKNLFGWFWEHQSYNTTFLDKCRSPIFTHPITKDTMINLSVNIIEKIRNDTTGLYSSIVEKLKQHSPEIKDEFAEVLNWETGDFVLWDNCQAIHTRPGWDHLINSPQDPEREFWRVNMIKPL